MYCARHCKPNNILEKCCRICDPPLHPNRWCSNCKYTHIKESKYKPYCFLCYCILNPDVEIPRKYKLKEHYLRDELTIIYTYIQLVFDKKIDDDCSLRRPDVRIECDEHKHTVYSCENKRMM